MRHFQLFLLVLFLVNCESTEEAQEYYDDGTLKALGQKRNDLKQGKWISFYKSGDTLQVEHFKDGLRHGELRVFYQNSDKLAFTQEYLNDTIGGTNRMWNEQGILVEESERISEGTYHGPAKLYFDNGDIHQVIEWRNGEGVSVKSYYPNGTLNFESEDLINGTSNFYNSLGKLILTVRRENGTTIDTLFRAL